MKATPLVYITIGVVALGLVAALTYQNRALRRNILSLQQRSIFLDAGDYLPPLAGISLTGDSINIASGSALDKHLLFYFDSKCPYCLESLPLFNRLAAGATSERAVIGLSLDSPDTTREYRERHALVAPILSLTSERDAHLYGAFGVPQWVIARGDGLVLYSRRGALRSDAAVDSLETVLSAPPADDVTPPGSF